MQEAVVGKNNPVVRSYCVGKDHRHSGVDGRGDERPLSRLELLHDSFRRYLLKLVLNLA
jgi:hypothetical protein